MDAVLLAAHALPGASDSIRFPDSAGPLCQLGRGDADRAPGSLHTSSARLSSRRRSDAGPLASQSIALCGVSADNTLSTLDPNDADAVEHPCYISPHCQTPTRTPIHADVSRRHTERERLNVAKRTVRQCWRQDRMACSVDPRQESPEMVLCER
jgi:hypothetical protein